MEKLLTDLVREGKFNITHLNFTTYGASMIHTDVEGNLLTPLYNYLKPLPKNIRQSFYQKYGDERTIALETASPSLDLLNAGLQLYFLKITYPERFARIKWSFHLPQYLCYYFTRQPVSEYTSIGCHTALWHFSKNDYHQWVYDEQLVEKFPPIQAAGTTTVIKISGQSIQTGIGMHDSSASLYPYTISSAEPYLLLSTGTWSITLNPFSEEMLSAEVLDRDCLLFLQPNGKPVKAARLFLGFAFQQKLTMLTNYFNNQLKEIAEEAVDYELLETISSSGATHFTFSALQKEESPIEPEDLSLYETFQQAYYQMTWDLSCHQKDSILLAAEGKNFPQMFLEGGFSKNKLFIACLKKHFPAMELKISGMASGASLGAALQVMRKKNK
jgi:sugar (pentulose or hexulose) kinase